MTRHLLDEVLDAKQQRGEARPVDPISERVERGAALLDEKQPGWLDMIDLARLDIGSSCNCVGGQIGRALHLGTFVDVMGDLGLRASEEAEYGFEHDAEADYDELTAAWRTLILARRAAAQVPA